MISLKTINTEGESSLTQLWHFVLHLRWHYQLFILSGGFLLGGFLSADLNVESFVIQFFNVHLLLFGGATAYNSYWDKDTGPIGGLKTPPPMTQWMWLASLLLQMVGLMIAIPRGSLFVTVYALSMLFFWLYSTPMARWKSRPIKSLIAIGLSTGFNSVLLGYLAAGNMMLSMSSLIAATGVTFMLLSLYPLSQIYQQDEDLRRGDQTFALQYGNFAVYRFFEISFLVGLMLVSVAIFYSHTKLALLFGGIGVVIWFLVHLALKKLTAQEEDYEKVMWIKYGTSMAFVLFLILALTLKHNSFFGISSAIDLLLK